MVINDPMVLNSAMMLDELEPDPQRAAYMVIKALHELQKASQDKS